MTDTSDPLASTWYAKPDDLIGGWCVMDVNRTPAEAQRPEIAAFTSQALAEHIADLHNANLERENWPYTHEDSPYARLKAYADGAGETPSREDVAELLRSFNAASSMNRVHRSVIDRQKRRFAAVAELAETGRVVQPGALKAALATATDRKAWRGLGSEED
ncbi:hypothetical protein [Actinocrinis sp.]|uniref:hypothetical protein n=1 Tax=Actinocrinis sp. TaxID=1920516 RepID=UPI002D486715|nr:hypothetical protein [Actinocrinis sp.]HZP53876.1 hypothetical protein [Actinocrinis sp.]